MEYQFETTRTTEVGLRVLDDAIMKTLRRTFGVSYLRKHNPDWIHRGVQVRVDGPSCELTIYGMFFAKSTTNKVRYEGKFTVNLVRARGATTPMHVTGSFTEEPKFTTPIKFDEVLSTKNLA